MKDIILFSNQQIKKEICVDKLKNIIINIKDNGNDLMIDAKNRLYLNFSNQRINEPKDESSEFFQKIIPIENAYLTFIETYRSIDAKRVVEILLSIYQDLYVYIDDIEWCGKAREFLTKQFEFWFSIKFIKKIKRWGLFSATRKFIGANIIMI